MAISTGLSFKFRESRSSLLQGYRNRSLCPLHKAWIWYPRASVAAAKSQAAGANLIEDGAAKQGLLLAQDALYNGLGPSVAIE